MHGSAHIETLTEYLANQIFKGNASIAIDWWLEWSLKENSKESAPHQS
jgi:hypothetical protein